MTIKQCFLNSKEWDWNWIAFSCIATWGRTSKTPICQHAKTSLPMYPLIKLPMVFPVVMFGCESWTVKKAERQRIDAFELWCWRRLLRIPWTARRSNQPILKEISPEYSLEGLMLKLKLPILWPPDAKNWLIGKDSSARKDWGQEEKGTTEWDGWMASPTQWTWVWVNSRS